ncbi:flavin reductase family protein [Longispora albida]|uniref:flavin reductase family protein n=1 Tax=Longispora albida TaxID=203523 RepID=UPI00036718BF|nr:flavin reductase family protein [Longispora albida]
MPAIPAADYRRVLGQFPTGVVVVTTAGPSGPAGLSVNAFSAVSLHPPLIGFFPAHTSGSWPVIRETGTFCVNILAADQEQLARLFATPGADRFAGLEYSAAPKSGAPLIKGVAGWLDCRIEAVTQAGDHDFVLGRVLALDTDPAIAPLIYHRGGYLPA